MNKSANAVLGFVLWSQALFLASTFRSWSVVMAFAAIATLAAAAFSRRELVERQAKPSMPRWLRWIMLAVSFALVAVLVAFWRIGSQVDRDINPVQVGVDILAHAMMAWSLILWLMRPRSGHLAMLPLGLLVVLLSVAAGGTSTSLAAQTTVALATCLGFTIGSQLILGASRAEPLVPSARDRNTERSKWLTPAFSLLTLSLLMMGTSAVANVTNLFLPGIQNRLQEQLKSSLDAVAEQTVVGGTRYVASGRLGSIRQHMLGSPREVALQVYCEVPPGYLRGSVFDLYRGSRWLDSGSVEISRMIQSSEVRDTHLLPVGAGVAKLRRSLNPPLQRFPLSDSNAQATIDLEVHNDPFKGPMVFLPLSTRWLEARSREIVVTNHTIVRIGVDVTRPYVASVGTMLPRSELTPTMREITTDLSLDIESAVRELAQSVCGTATTATEKAKAISDHFQQKYSYSLAQVQIPSDMDPLVYFLQTKHDAHCEYFASATALMLRSVGVPSRYVIGYVADEPSEEVSGRWLARNQDAHAWVEAYDDQTGRWFPVESTPGRTYQTVEPERQSNGVADMLAGLLDRDSDEQDTLAGRILGWIGSMRASDPLLWLFRIAQLPLFLVLAFLLWNRYLKPTVRGGEDPADVLSRKLLRQVDRRLQRFSLQRRPSETLYQFAERIDRYSLSHVASQRPDFGQQLAGFSAWYRAYADARYQGQVPRPLEESTRWHGGFTQKIHVA